MTNTANHLTDEQIEQILATHTADRVRPEDMDRCISKVDYQVLQGSTVTICSITLDNGYSVRGESACVDPANFNADVGATYAYQDAYEKLWPLFGFLLAEKRHIRRKPAVDDRPTLGQGGFGYALHKLKFGHRVARAGWNGKGMWLALSCNGSREVPAAGFWAPANKAWAEANGGKATVLPSITMKTATGEILMGWLASQTDILAEDWHVVE